MTSISAIFFDLDGTLVDSSIGIHNAFTHTFKELGVPSPDAKTIRGFMGPPLESSFATCLPKEQIAPQQSIIIGDTKFDMLGAQETGIQKLAVTWGFGEQADLLNYQPDYMAHNPLQVLEYFQ